MAIQQAVNQALATAALGAGGYKHFHDQEIKEQALAKDMLIEADLKGSADYQKGEISDTDIKAYRAAAALGMRPSSEYLPQHNRMKAILAESNLNDEQIAKKVQNQKWRTKLLTFQGGSEALAQARRALTDSDVKRVNEINGGQK